MNQSLVVNIPDSTIIQMSLDDTKRCITIHLPKTAVLFILVQKSLSYSNIIAKLHP